AGPTGLLLSGAEGPQLAWRDPATGTAARTVVVRAGGRCPSDHDIAIHSLPLLYDRPVSPGRHTFTDTSFPNTAGSYCYRVFTISTSGRATQHPAGARFRLAPFVLSARAARPGSSGSVWPGVWI